MRITVALAMLCSCALERSAAPQRIVDSGSPRDGGPNRDAGSLDAGPSRDAGCGGPPRCEGEVLVRCEDGREERRDCAAEGSFCRGGSCEARVCEPDTVTCVEGASVTCDSRGESATSEPCAHGCDPATGECVDAPDCPFDVEPLPLGTTTFDLCEYESNHLQESMEGCTAVGQANGRERVFFVSLSEATKVQVDAVDADEDVFIDTLVYIRSDCDRPESQVACEDDSPGFGESRLTTTLDAGTYFVFVDHWANTSSCGDVRMYVELGDDE